MFTKSKHAQILNDTQPSDNYGGFECGLARATSTCQCGQERYATTPVSQADGNHQLH
jgi:hypothetical protein